MIFGWSLPVVRDPRALWILNSLINLCSFYSGRGHRQPGGEGARPGRAGNGKHDTSTEIVLCTYIHTPKLPKTPKIINDKDAIEHIWKDIHSR